mmetsp:Transcript_17478/g.40632  ORF Transcript_17478/g.40632 Transcript_17478/m.40632 type:complete len:82 (-) Transcript_17478:23-268(-)
MAVRSAKMPRKIVVVAAEGGKPSRALPDPVELARVTAVLRTSVQCPTRESGLYASEYNRMSPDPDQPVANQLEPSPELGSE